MKRSILKTTLLLLPFQVVFRAGEGLLPVLLAAWFGASNATDVYNFAWSIFIFAGSLIFTAYQDSAIVPILMEVKARDEALLGRVRGSLLAHTLTIGSALAIGIGALAMLWFRLRYTGNDFTLAARLVAPFCVYLVLLSVKTFLVALLNAEHRYFAAPIASSFAIVTTITFIALSRSNAGIAAVAIGLTLGELVSIAILSIVAFGLLKMKVVWTLDRPEPVMRFARLIASEVGGSAVTRINPVVDLWMAGLSGVVAGATLLRNTSDVASVATSLLQATLLPVLLSHLAEDFTGARIERIRGTVVRSLSSVSAVLLAASVLLYFLRAPLFRFVFLRGVMPAEAVERMITIFPYQLVGIVPFGALLVLARAHVAIKNSRIMVSMGALNASLNVVFDLVLLRVMGIEGIALATSLVHLAIAVVFWCRLESRLGVMRREATT